MSLQHKNLLRIIQAILAIFLVYFSIRLALYHYHLVIYPFPNTLREGAMMSSTLALLKGLNPYDISLQPQFMNQYGIMYPLSVWPLAKLFGCTILIHRTVCAFSILASCLLIALVLKRMSVPIVLNLWAILMLYSSWMYPGTSTPTIDPGATGMFLFLLTIFIPWLGKFSYRSLILSLIFGVLSFYTKIYTFLGVFIILSYLFLFISKKKAIIYGFLLLILMVISVGFVNRIFSTYFDNCFFAALNMGPSWSTMQRLKEQLIMFKDIHLWTLILTGVLLLWHCFKFLTNQGLDKIKKNISEIFQIMKLNKFNEPLIKLNYPLILHAGICSLFILYISLGRHNGATLWYFFQLLSPFFIMGSAWLFSQLSYWPLFCAPILIFNLFTITADQDYKCFNEKLNGWPEITKLIKTHQHILNSPLIAPLMIEQNKDLVDDGQAEYFLPGGERNNWMKGWLKTDDRIMLQHLIFFENIKFMVENKAYDIIILQPGLMPMGVAQEIRKYYKSLGQANLYVPQDRRPYAITIWLPQ